MCGTVRCLAGHLDVYEQQVAILFGARTHKSARLPALLMLVAITMVAVDRVYPAPADELRAGARAAFSAGGALASSVWPSEGPQETRLQQENNDLRRQLEEAQGALLASGDQQRRLQALENRLALPSLGSTRRVTAPVIATSLANFDSAIELAKGSSEGIRAGMPVINGSGLVGRVTKVSANRSTVLLVNDSTFEVGVRFSRSGEVAIGVGQGARAGMRVDLVGADAKVTGGDVAVTNGQQFSLFPPGIPVATVNESKSEGASPKRKVTMNPVVDLDHIDYVEVLKWEAPL